MNTPQWLATDDGIEGAGDYRGYFIDKARLGEGTTLATYQIRPDGRLRYLKPQETTP